MNELHRRLLAGQQGRDRADAARRYVEEACGGVFDADTLQDLANGPIIDPNAIYLPAGKLSEAEYRRRQSEQRRRGLDG